MNVLIACEESQAVCKAFREIGHTAFSCDLYPCTGGHPEWHIKGDCLPIIDGDCEFITQDGVYHHQDGEWDILIAHPPCTFLSQTSLQWCNVEKYGIKAVQRIQNQEEAVKFFMRFVTARCKHIAIENPVGVMSKRYKKPDQYIRPCEFGHGTGKKTGLWVKNLPLLKPTNVVPIEYVVSRTGRLWDAWFYECSMLKGEERRRFRAKTFQGVADAMAVQYSNFVERIDNYEHQD